MNSRGGNVRWQIADGLRHSLPSDDAGLAEDEEPLEAAVDLKEVWASQAKRKSRRRGSKVYPRLRKCCDGAPNLTKRALTGIGWLALMLAR